MFQNRSKHLGSQLAQWKLKEIDACNLSQSNYSAKILSFYETNPGVVFDFSIPHTSGVQPNVPVDKNMSNKRPFKSHVDEFNGSKREIAPHFPNKRARRQTGSSSSASDTLQSESDINRLRGGEERIKRIKYSGHSSREVESSKSQKVFTITPKNDINKGNESRLPGYYQYKKPSTVVDQPTAPKADQSWHSKKSDSTSTTSRDSSIDRSVMSTTPGYHQYIKSSTIVDQPTVSKADQSWHSKKSDSTSTVSRDSSIDRSVLSATPGYHQYKKPSTVVDQPNVPKADRSWRSEKSDSTTTVSRDSSIVRSVLSATPGYHQYKKSSTVADQPNVPKADRSWRSEKSDSTTTVSRDSSIVRSVLSATPGYHQYKKSSTVADQPNVPKADRSWRSEKSDSTTTVSRDSSIDRSVPRASQNFSETSNLISPTAWSTEVKVNNAEKRLALLQQKLRRNQELPSCSSNYQEDQLVHGSNEVLQKTNSESATKLIHVGECSATITRGSLQPTKSARECVDNQLFVKSSEKHTTYVHHPQNLTDNHVKECPGKQVSCLSTPSNLPSKNLAATRLERLQQQLRQQGASTSGTQSPALPTRVTTPVRSSNTAQTRFSESPKGVVNVDSCQDVLSSGGAPTGDGEETNDDFEEKMDWEPTNNQVNSLILDIQKVRTQLQDRDLVPKHSTPNYQTCTSKKSNYFIVLDSNILMGHLKLVEALRDRQFQVLEPLVLILPWMVIQELDKLKDWRINSNNDGHNAMAASLARTAVKWINLQLQGKHPRVKGQVSFNRTAPVMECSVADDSILACCKEMEPFAANVVLLTEDVNLSNKALMLGIQVVSQSQLKARLNKLAIQPLSRSYTSQSNAVENPEPCRPLNALSENVINSEESEKSDMILCDVKIVVQNYLEEVAQTKMAVAYGKKWFVDLKISLPWLGLNEVIQFIIKRWRSVFGYVCDDRSNLSKFEELLAFMQDKKAYNHSLKEVSHFIGSCTDIVNSMIIEPNCSLQEECLKSLKQLQDQCKNVPAKRLSSETEFQAERILIEKPLEKIWFDLRMFCYSSCEYLQIKHDIQVPLELQNQTSEIDLETIRDELKDTFARFNGLIFCLKRLLEIPPDQMTTDNTILQNLHGILTKLHMDYYPWEQYPSIDSLAMYTSCESSRKNIEVSIELFFYFNWYLERISAF